MRLLNRLFNVFTFFISICSVNQFFANEGINLEHIFSIEPSSEEANDRIEGFSVNKNLEMVWCERGFKGHNVYFYSNVELCGNSLNITEIVGEQLLQLGYNPKLFYTQEDCKPWDSKYYLIYGIGPADSKLIDENGNILLSFTHEGNKNLHGDLKKLGVWNKEYGFKEIDTHEIDNVGRVIVRGNYMFIHGTIKDSHKQKVVVLSIKDGYWGEQKQIEAEEKPKPEKSWWDWFLMPE